MFDSDDLFDELDTDDKDRKEQEDMDAYWLYSEAERTLNTNMELDNISNELDISNELPKSHDVFTTLTCMGNLWILDISKMSKEKIYTANKYLSRYKTDKGIGMVVRSDASQKLLKSKYSRDIDLVGLQIVLEKVS